MDDWYEDVPVPPELHESSFAATQFMDDMSDPGTMDGHDVPPYSFESKVVPSADVGRKGRGCGE